MSTVDLVHANPDLRVALAYADDGIPRFEMPRSITRLLVDMDFYVEFPTGRLFFGNNHEYNDAEHFRTDERVIIPKNKVEVGNYTIHVVSRF